MKYVIPIFIGAAILFQASCATTTAKPVSLPDRTSLIIARSGSEVTLSWKSTEGRVYTVLYTERDKTKADHWQPLPDCINKAGTGRMIILKDASANARKRPRGHR